MRTIFSRSFRGFLVVVVILSVLAPALIFGTVRSRFRTAAMSDLERTAEALSWGLSPMLEDSTGRLDSIVTDLDRKVGVRITIIASDGVVLADSEEDPDSMENHRTRPEVICAFNGQTRTMARFSETLDREMLYSAVPVFRGDSIPMVVRTSLFISELSSTVRRIAIDMAIMGFVLLLSGLVAAWLFSRSLSAPIRSMAGVTRRVKGGDFTARVAPSSIREVDGLSADINAMISRTSELIQTLSAENAAREAILRSILEGLAVVDGEGRLVSANHSFSVMACGGDPLRPEVPAEHVATREFRDYITGTLRGDAMAARVESGGRVYSASHAAVRGSDRTVFTFSDITELDDLVRIKRDFAANVSHELRTPLTSIKGFSETLLEETPEGEREHVETILRNTDRLIRLVDDIRILSEFEHPGRALELRPVDIVQVVEELTVLYRRQAESKGLELLVEIEEGLPVIQADRFGVEQVLANLLENAIRYTSSGSVTLRVGVRARLLTMVVSDTGNGIEREHLSRIFERFYVVDRARSRERGGTGLGLSIVKHIMTLHGGWVRVTSTPGAGSMFTIAFPLDSPLTSCLAQDTSRSE
jgi:two-component system, OmpR family, phosphate regulon sensor histidine kinase PhoR